MPRYNQCRRVDRATCKSRLHDIRHENSFYDFILKPKGLGSVLRHENRVVPSQFRHGIRPLLHPTVIRISAIVHCARLDEVKLKGGDVLRGAIFYLRKKTCH